MPASNILAIESLIAQAHRRLFIAFNEASHLAKDDLSEDLWDILIELERVQVSLLKAYPKRKMPF